MTGLPRSRTCWLAAWLTTDRSLCLHDGTRGHKSVLTFAESLRGTPARPLRGSSGSDLLMYAENLGNVLPRARWVVVERRAVDALASFNRAFPQFDKLQVADAFIELARHLEKLDDVLPLEPLRVRFEDLDDESTARRVWDHCLEGAPFDAGRWRLMRQWNIQLDRNKCQLEKDVLWLEHS